MKPIPFRQNKIMEIAPYFVRVGVLFLIYICQYCVNIATINKVMFTIKVNSSYVVIRNDLLSIRLGNRGNSYPGNFLDKYSIFAFLYCNDNKDLRRLSDF